jgi:hypothetical protein
VTQIQNQIHRTILVPNDNESQLAAAPSGIDWGLTVIQQCQLSVSSPSPMTLTFTNPVTVGDTVSIFVQLNDDTVASVTDDVGNPYTQLTSGTFPGGGQYFEVWTSPSVQTAPTGVVVTTTGGSNVLVAILSEINAA